MSHHYNASQYSEPFKPTRLNNYSPFNNTPCAPYGVHAMCLPDRCCPTQVIADENGWLLPCIPRGPSSPWGDYAYGIWEQPPFECLCVSMLRHPEKYAPPRQIYIAREEHNHEQEAKKVAECINTCGWGQSPCMLPASTCCKPRAGGFCEGIQMKVILCGDNPVERKRLVKELRRQQREYRRMVAGTRGACKGKVPFSPAEFRAVTWDGCAGAGNKDRYFGRAFGCRKS